MRIKISTLALLVLLTSCFNMNDYCNEETSKITKLQCKFKVTKVTNKNKRTTISGIDSLGNEQSFYYGASTVMDYLVKPGMILTKDSGTTIFRLQKNLRITTIKWDCLTQGKIISQERIESNHD